MVRSAKSARELDAIYRRRSAAFNPAGHMSVTLLRQWTLLKNIPRAPGHIEIGALMARLEAAGLSADKRTVQRDLKALSQIFPLHEDDRTPTPGWSWAADAPTCMQGVSTLGAKGPTWSES